MGFTLGQAVKIDLMQSDFEMYRELFHKLKKEAQKDSLVIRSLQATNQALMNERSTHESIAQVNADMVGELSRKVQFLEKKIDREEKIGGVIIVVLATLLIVK